MNKRLLSLAIALALPAASPAASSAPQAAPRAIATTTAKLRRTEPEAVTIAPARALGSWTFQGHAATRELTASVVHMVDEEDLQEHKARKQASQARRAARRQAHLAQWQS